MPPGVGVGPLESLLKSVMPEPARFEAVMTGVGHIQLLAQQLMGVNAACVVQGSYAQGLGLRASDLDIAIIADPSTPIQKASEATEAAEKQKALRCLKMLAHEIASLGSAEIRIALRIFSARVPVLRLHFALGVGCSTHVAQKENDVASARLVVDVTVGANLGRGACDRCVHSLLESDRSGLAAALCRLVKLWAKRRQLTNTLRGGLSSFGFVLLVITFLQHLEDPRLRPSHRNKGKARLPPWPSSVKLPSYGALAAKRPKVHCIKGDRKTGADFSCPRILPAPEVGAELVLTLLLAEFFKWAFNQLPSLCAEHSLSIETARIERRQQYGGSPLLLTVPFTSHDNAARCLRKDIWEGRILPEFSRAQRLITRLVRPPTKAPNQGRAKASTLKSLFSSKGAQESSSDEQSVQHLEARPLDWKMGKRIMSADSCTNDEITIDNGDAIADNSTLRPVAATVQRGRKRRRAWSDRDIEAEALAHPAKPRSLCKKDSDVVVSPESRPAPVERWLGLRALLNPADANR